MAIIKIKDLSEKLKVTRQTIYNMKKIGLPYIKIGKNDLRFDEDEVLKWLKERG